MMSLSAATTEAIQEAAAKQRLTLADVRVRMAHVHDVTFERRIDIDAELTDEDNNVIRAKEAYYAVRNLATLWDEADTPVDDFSVIPVSPLQHSLWRFRDSETCLNSFVLWHDASVPGNSARFVYEDVEVCEGTFSDPVAVDVRTGKVYRVEMDGTLLRRVPVYDSPVFVMEKKLLKI